MTGKIEIICDDTGVHVSANVQGTRDSDRAFLVHSVGKVLGLEYIDYMVIAMAEAQGVMNTEGEPVEITIDTEELRRQLKEEHNES